MTPGALVFRALLVLALALPALGSGQTVEGGGAVSDTLPPVEATALLEKTFLRIDVARLRVGFGASTVEAMEELLAEREGIGAESGREARSNPLRANPAVADSLAGIAIRSTDAWASLTFLWGIGFERFVQEMRSGARVAADAGLIDPAFLRTLSRGFPVWYAPLRERGIRDGDAMSYRISGDSLRTTFLTEDGRVVVDQVDVGEQARLSVLGGFFAPGSEFRRQLLESLVEALEARTSRSGMASPGEKKILSERGSFSRLTRPSGLINIPP